MENFSRVCPSYANRLQGWPVGSEAIFNDAAVDGKSPICALGGEQCMSGHARGRRRGRLFIRRKSELIKYALLNTQLQIDRNRVRERVATRPATGDSSFDGESFAAKTRSLRLA